MAPSSFNDQDLSITTSVIPVKSKNDAVSNMDRGRFDSRSISLPQRPIPAVIAVDNPATMNIGPIIFWVIVFSQRQRSPAAHLVRRTVRRLVRSIHLAVRLFHFPFIPESVLPSHLCVALSRSVHFQCERSIGNVLHLPADLRDRPVFRA